MLVVTRMGENYLKVEAKNISALRGVGKPGVSVWPGTAGTSDETIVEQMFNSENIPENLRISFFSEFVIRLLDIIGSAAGLILFFPLFIFIALLIKIFSDGPVLYKQKRVGKAGKIFTLYKFRTMVEHAEKVWGLMPAKRNDHRVTKIGKMLRRTRLDELPQLFNVLKGDMSLVGPRPENLYRVNMHKALRGVRLAVKPGITGLAQIRALYDVKPDHKLKYDYLYIQRRSVRLNIYILMKTPPAVLAKKGW